MDEDSRHDTAQVRSTTPALAGRSGHVRSTDSSDGLSSVHTAPLWPRTPFDDQRAAPPAKARLAQRCSRSYLGAACA